MTVGDRLIIKSMRESFTFCEQVGGLCANLVLFVGYFWIVYCSIFSTGGSFQYHVFFRLE